MLKPVDDELFARDQPGTRRGRKHEGSGGARLSLNSSNFSIPLSALLGSGNHAIMSKT